MRPEDEYISSQFSCLDELFLKYIFLLFSSEKDYTTHCHMNNQSVTTYFRYVFDSLKRTIRVNQRVIRIICSGFGKQWLLSQSCHQLSHPRYGFHFPASLLLHTCTRSPINTPATRGVMHSLFLRGHEFGGGGLVMWHTAATTALTIYLFIFIQNIPKRINYIMKYLDYHLYRLLVDIVGDGQSNLIM